MPYRTPPKRPSIETKGARRWLEDRGIDADEITLLVGKDPDHPRISKRQLGREIGTSSLNTVARLLEQFKREMVR